MYCACQSLIVEVQRGVTKYSNGCNDSLESGFSCRVDACSQGYCYSNGGSGIFKMIGIFSFRCITLHSSHTTHR